jgi:hypothetical protein
MTYGELLASLKTLTPDQLALEAFGYEGGQPVFWLGNLGSDRGHPTIEGTVDLGGDEEPAPILKLHKGR